VPLLTTVSEINAKVKP